MPVKINLDQIAQLAPNVRSSYREAIRNGQAVVDEYKIAANPLRMAHFMAQVLHESGGLTRQFENLNYSAARLPKVWPSRFQPKGPLDPAAYANNPRKLANAVYGRRMGNDNPDDGFNYRGRGLLQLTGKDGYRQASEHLRQSHPDAPDFVAFPDEVIGARWCLAVAAAEWFAKGCNALADQDDLGKVTRAINGGQNGLAERRDWLARTRAVWK